MTYVRGMLIDVSTMEDFSKAIGVERKALNIVVPLSKKCATNNCPFFAIDRNRLHCVLHCKAWVKKNGTRGSNMRGVGFLPPKLEDHIERTTCCCDMKSCFNNGHCSMGYVSMPIDNNVREGILSTINLFKSDTQDKIRSGEMKRPKLALWHYYSRHREQDANGKWKLLGKLPSYYDDDMKKYSYPPPRYCPDRYCTEEYPRYVHPKDYWIVKHEEGMSQPWIKDMIRKDAIEASFKINEILKPNSELSRDACYWKNKAVEEGSRALNAEELNSIHVTRLKHLEDKNNAMQVENITLEEENLVLKKENIAHIKENEAMENGKREKIEWLNVKIKGLEKDINEANTLVEELQHTLNEVSEAKGFSPLRFEDLKPGGALADHVGSLTYFSTYKSNELFLKMINYVDPNSIGKLQEGDGLCENIRLYSHVKFDERCGDKEAQSLGNKGYGEWKKKHSAGIKSRDLNMCYKDEYFLYCVYVCCGITMEVVGCLFGIKSSSHVSDIVHAWAHILDNALKEMFPRPTISQILQAFPDRLVRVDGDARCWCMLDAFEIFTQNPSYAAAHASMRSDYKGHTTAKFLAAVDPIGTSWGKSVSDGFPGGGSDNFLMRKTKILEEVPFGRRAKVDKGFTDSNHAAEVGIILDRPKKKAKHQKQQSAEDTCQTQKVAAPRIVVENVNGEAKMSSRYVNALIGVNMFGIVSEIVRVAYLMQNFKLGIIQRRGPDVPRPPGGRPSRAEIRYYGATDAGLSDLRPHVQLWGTQSEIQRHDELKKENPILNDTEISEMVLKENISDELRQEHYKISKDC